LEENARTKDQEDGKDFGKALIADDDADFRGLLVRRAQKMGLEVVEVDDGPKAVEKLKDGAFDVLVTDLYMPGCTGIDVVRAGLRIDPELQAIVLTGSASLDTALDALRVGVYDYLLKPLESVAIFEMALSRALERRQLIRENARLFAEVQRLAMTDPLTGLFNRHKLGEVLEAEVDRAGRYGRPLSMLLLDLDSMKAINDSYGHAAGDAVLKIVADSIRSQVRKVDFAARLGGDEFLVLLPEADLQMAGKVATRVFSTIRSARFHEAVVSVSIGVGQWAPQYRSAKDFMHAVDQALYQAKKAGGEKIVACVQPSVKPLEEAPSYVQKGGTGNRL